MNSMWLLLIVWLTTPIIVYLSVKAGTCGYLRGRELYYRIKLKEKNHNGFEKK